jgi:hypothetical protein
MEIVQNLERVLMPQFHIIREGLCADFPKLEHRVYSNSGGDLTPNPWHVMGVSCLLHRDWDNPPNEVMIQVDVISLKSQPTLRAYVMWDSIMTPVHDLFPRPIPVSDEAIMKIEKALPDLLGVLKGQVRRGKPPASLARAET